MPLKVRKTADLGQNPLKWGAQIHNPLLPWTPDSFVIKRQHWRTTVYLRAFLLSPAFVAVWAQRLARMLMLQLLFSIYVHTLASLLPFHFPNPPTSWTYDLHAFGAATKGLCLSERKSPCVCLSCVHCLHGCRGVCMCVRVCMSVHLCEHIGRQSPSSLVTPLPCFLVGNLSF